MDDGADLVSLLHTDRADACNGFYGGNYNWSYMPKSMKKTIS